MQEYIGKAERILHAMENSPVPVDWSEMDREDLAAVIAKELKIIEKEDKKENCPDSRQAKSGQ